MNQLLVHVYCFIYRTYDRHSILLYTHTTYTTLKVARGLKHMHERKIVHCDIKPDNILFLNEDTNSLKIIDFGASKFLIDVNR